MPDCSARAHRIWMYTKWNGGTPLANANATLQMRMRWDCSRCSRLLVDLSTWIVSISATLTHHRKVQNLNSYHFFDWLFKVLISNLHIHAVPSRAEKKNNHTHTHNHTHTAHKQNIKMLSVYWAKFLLAARTMPPITLNWISGKSSFPLCMKLIFTGPCSGWFNFFLVYADADLFVL